MKVLIAEDDAETAALLQQGLQNAGCESAHAADGKIALELIDSSRGMDANALERTIDVHVAALVASVTPLVRSLYTVTLRVTAPPPNTAVLARSLLDAIACRARSGSVPGASQHATTISPPDADECVPVISLTEMKLPDWPALPPQSR